MNILEMAKYYVDNINNKEHYDKIKESVLRNKTAVLQQINTIINSNEERERIISDVKNSLNKNNNNNNNKRFTIEELQPIKYQRNILRFQIENLTSTGQIKIRTNHTEYNSNVISEYYLEEQNLIVTLIIEHMIDNKNNYGNNAESYAYITEYILLKIEEETVHKLTELDSEDRNSILLSALRTMISYIIAYGIFKEEILQYDADSMLQYVKEQKNEYESIKQTLLLMNNY